MHGKTIKYEPLSADEDLVNDSIQDEIILERRNATSRMRTYRCRFLLAVFLTLTVFNIALLFVGIARCTQNVVGPSMVPKSPGLVYSPAREAISYEVRRFNPVLHQNDSNSEYMGQSNAVDVRWDALLKYGIQRITKEEAYKMVEPSAPIPGDEDHVILTLGIFHEIHCLNVLRKMLHPEYYPPAPPDSVPIPQEHADHCIDWIRQTLMCSVDINPMVFEWDEEKQVAIPKLSALHLCRSFDAVNEWAKNHHMVGEFDNLPHIQLRL